MCRTVSKVSLIIANGIFALFSLICLIIGIYVAATTATLFSPSQSSIFSSRLLFVSVGLFILVSGLCLLICLLGFCGALKESKNVLTLYSAILTVSLVLQLVTVGLAFGFGSMVETNVVKKLLDLDKNAFLPFNQIEEKHANSTAVISHLMHSLHVSMRCCGTWNYTDIANSDTAWHRAKPMYKNLSMQIPASCCVLSDDGVKYLPTTWNWANFGDYLPHDSPCPNRLDQFYAKGCMPAIQESIMSHLFGIYIASVIFILLQIICITMACCLLVNHRRRKYHSV